MSAQKDEIPAELLAFVHHCIDSVESLQVLTLLLENRNHPWTVDLLSDELRSSRASVQKRVQDLQGCGVLLPEALSPTGELKERCQS